MRKNSIPLAFVLASLISLFFHNFVSALWKVEEPVFFLLTFFFAFEFLVSFVGLIFHWKKKKILIWGAIFFLLILDWAALDDITTGNEPNYFLEYAILFISLLVFGWIGFIALRKKG